MQDDKLLVCYEKVASDGDILLSKGKVIDDNLVSINDLLTKKWDKWQGEDSDAFILSLQDFIKKIKAYSDTVQEVGGYLQAEAQKYNKALATCVKELDQNG